jgi:hypothetical protein
LAAGEGGGGAGGIDEDGKVNDGEGAGSGRAVARGEFASEDHKAVGVEADEGFLGVVAGEGGVGGEGEVAEAESDVDRAEEFALTEGEECGVRVEV